MKYSKLDGLGYLLGYLFLIAIHDVFFGRFLQQHNPDHVAITVAAFCALSFHISQAGKLRDLFSRAISNWKSVLVFNIGTVFSWLGFYYSLEYIEPSVAVMICFAIAPVTTFFILRISGYSRDSVSLLQKISIAGILVGLIACAWFTFVGKTSIQNLSFRAAFLGVLWSVICGVATVGCNLVSKRLSNRGFSPSEILCFRWYLFLPLALILMPRTHSGDSSLWDFLKLVIPMGAITVTVALFCFQRAVKITSPMVIATLLPLLPGFIFLLQYLDSRLQPSFAILGTILFTSFFCILGGLSSQKKKWKILAIVDAYSSASIYPKLAAERGYLCVHIQSSVKIPDGYRRSFNPNDFEENIVLNGNWSQVLTKLRKWGPEAVMAGTESGVELADQLSEVLGVRTNGTPLSEARRDKFLMGRAVKKAKLRTARQIVAKTLPEIRDWMVKENLSIVVVKPIKSAGSDGVRVCHSFSEVSAAFRENFQKVNRLGHKNDGVLVQEFIDGTEYIVNSVTSHGKHRITLIVRYRKNRHTDGKVLYDWEELIDQNDEAFLPLVEYTHRALDALGIKFGPTHAEIMIDRDGPVMVEIASRLDGGSDIEIEKRCLGFSQAEMALDAYLDDSAFEKNSRYTGLRQKFLAIHMVVKETPKTIPQDLHDWLEKLPSFAHLKARSHPGEIVQPTTDLFTSPGMIFLIHENDGQLLEDHQKIRVYESGWSAASGPQAVSFN